jgi:hypothetical protein
LKLWQKKKEKDFLWRREHVVVDMLPVTFVFDGLYSVTPTANLTTDVMTPTNSTLQSKKRF